jgi:hypothetical protein
MDSANPQNPPSPPSLMKALMAGFDAISNHIGLVFFSVLLDLVLWFGPRLRMEALFRGILEQSAAMPEMQGQQDVLKQFMTLLQGFNFMSFLRTIPVGVPSLMVGKLSLVNPLANCFGIFSFWPVVAVGRDWDGRRHALFFRCCSGCTF